MVGGGLLPLSVLGGWPGIRRRWSVVVGVADARGLSLGGDGTKTGGGRWWWVGC